MRSVKIENTHTGQQFAFGGHDGHALPAPIVGWVTRKGGMYLLHTGNGKSANTCEVRRDQRILVDYDTFGVEAVKSCTVHAEHGTKTSYPSGHLYCKPCHDAHLTASRARVKNRKITGEVKLTGEAAKAAARRADAEAKIDRLMARLALFGNTIAQQDARDAAKAIAAA